ncbi:hypothetical protein BT96DRAFT_922032 [Gymnopus androsaceus JB14]|uniref:Uncharacterized protein n=1 Tax=Gymnopus androsaceus JB14 TaxID=1447944 RepID=A0A6A4HHG9_9AGAR|nr:hypothetical protein BT96DRAFT_922032 [Gymnopus androsaceus JB14]
MGPARYHCATRTVLPGWLGLVSLSPIDVTLGFHKYTPSFAVGISLSHYCLLRFLSR